MYVITNTHTLETIEITGEKVWDNADDKDKPTSVTIHLFADGVEVPGKAITVTKDTKMVDDKAWTWKWSGLPKYKDKGWEIVYTVSEDTLKDYTLSVVRTPSGDGKSLSFVMTNTYDPNRITIRVQKVWNDNNDQDKIRPASIEVKLIADDGTVYTRILPEDGTWRTRFNVPESKDGTPIVYKAAETFTNVLTPGTDGPGTYKQEAITGNAMDGFVITNVHTPETVYIHGDKTWTGDESEPAGTRPESVTFVLSLYGQNIAFTVAEERNGYKWEFPLQPRYRDGIDVSRDYEVTEILVPGYMTEIDGWIDDNEQDYTGGVINIFNPNKTSVKVTKVWNDGNNQDGKRPERIAVQLYADGQAVEEKYLVLQGTGSSWTGTFKNLDIYEQGSTRPIVYTVKEVGTYAGYTTSDPTGSMAEGYTITNTYVPETVSIRGEKTWDDEDNHDGKRPSSVIVRLHAGGAEVAEKTVTPDAEGKWKYEFLNVPKHDAGRVIEYSVTEDTVPEYTSEYFGYDIVNRYTPGKTTVMVEKEWQDGGNQDGIRPDSITVKLLADGSDTGKTAELNERNEWKYEFRDLNEYAVGGKKIEYTIEEVLTDVITGIDGPGTYACSVGGDAAVGFEVENMHTPETVTVSGKKTWNDSGNIEENRPETIVVRLYAGETEVDYKIVAGGADNVWRWSFVNLPKYAHGEEICYSVLEDDVFLYTGRVDGFSITNTYKPETIDISGTKIWRDMDDYEGFRPESITVRLFDGENEVAHQTVSADSEGSWKYVFTGLPAYRKGKAIEYRVVEDPVAMYTTTYEGYNVVNTHEVETVEVSGVKLWADKSNADGIRPDSVVIRAVMNGEPTEYTATATKADGWEWVLTGLPKYYNKELINWTITEDPVEGYQMTIARKQDGTYQVSNYHMVIPTPPDFFVVDGGGSIELPETGITTVGGYPLSSKPASVNYLPTTMELQLPTLNILSSIVTVGQVDGRYPVEWLGYDAGLLEGTDKPGEGISVIAAHNTINSEDYGPFAMIMEMEEGDRFFITDEDGTIMIFQVYANEKIGSHDFDALWKVASEFDNTVTLLTCEDERAEGGYSARRAVSARRVN